MYVASQSVLSVYAHGGSAGWWVGHGPRVTYTVLRLLQGYNLPHATERLDLAAPTWTAFLAEMLLGFGATLGQQTWTQWRTSSTDIAVAPDFLKEQARPELGMPPDPEAARRTDGHAGQRAVPVPRAAVQSSRDPRAVPRGRPHHGPTEPLQGGRGAADRLGPERAPKRGSSLFTGFKARLNGTARSLPPEAHVVVMAQPSRNFSVWIGGSILPAAHLPVLLETLREHMRNRGPTSCTAKCY